jgi:hypothetical protein
MLLALRTEGSARGRVSVKSTTASTRRNEGDDMSTSKKLAKKLSLRAVTLRNLTADELGEVHGGASVQSYIVCPSAGGECPSAMGNCPSAGGKCQSAQGKC